jgi:hypothetical protein
LKAVNQESQQSRACGALCFVVTFCARTFGNRSKRDSTQWDVWRGGATIFGEGVEPAVGRHFVKICTLTPFYAIKVTGIPGIIKPPIAALFWIDPAQPDAGGTGHTIRACRLAGIPVIFQNDWVTWLSPKS